MQKVQIIKKNTGFGKSLYVGVYSFLFCVTAALVFFPYWRNGKSLIPYADAIYQHYPALAYYGEYLRECLRGIFLERTFVTSTWDMSIGYGSDIITTLHYYCLGDPLCLISVFFNADNMEFCYTLLVLLRLYLAGLTIFFYFCSRELDTKASVLAALMYSFSGYAVTAGIFHPFFMTPMIYLPLLLLGIDRIYKRDHPLVFILSVAFSALSNFYFFYMLVLFVVIYAIVEYFRYFSIKQCGVVFLKVLSYAIVGLMIAAPVMLPNILSILQSDRLSAGVTIPFAYPSSYYAVMPAALISEHASYYFYVSVCPVAMLAVFTLFSLPPKEYLKQKLALCSLLIFAMIPRIGSMFNGFGYATNRWIWCLAFVLCYITASMLPRTRNLTGKQKKIVIFLLGIYILLCLFPHEAREEKTISALIILILSVVLVTYDSDSRPRANTFYGLFLLLVVAGNFCNGWYWAAPKHGNWIGSCINYGEAVEKYNTPLMESVGSLEHAETGRYEADAKYNYVNSAMLHNVNGTSAYFSTITPGTSSFQRSQMLNISLPQRYNGFNGRSYLSAAMGVAYFYESAGSNEPKPYGYDLEKGSFEYGKILAIKDPLPIVYVFDGVYSNYEDLTVTQKQQALLQCAMTDAVTSLPEVQPYYTDYDLLYEIVDTDGIIIDANGWYVTKENASVTLGFQEVKDAELYVIIENLQFEPQETVTETQIGVQSGSSGSTVRYKTPFDNFYCSRHNFLLNAGFVNKEKELVLSFSATGHYYFDKLSVAAQPLSELTKQIELLADSGIYDIKVDRNMVSFSSDRDRPGIACIAIPYQDGWTAFVDSSEADVICIQEGLCGVFVTEGVHMINLQYSTPGLLTGGVLCYLGLTFIILYLLKKHQKRKSATENAIIGENKVLVNSKPNR